ncbi:MAG TPA: hypothetical protein VJS64_18820 [Pyrinomonadaceae bacterium]|nr:hypothetical protein [Pyrinomonadaceae bacterium]
MKLNCFAKSNSLSRVLSSFLILVLLSWPLVAQSNKPARTGEATVTLNEQFFNSFLEAIFDNLKAPSTPLVITASDRNRTDESAQACPSVITLQREYGAVRTAVKFEQGRMVAPLAFTGSYNSTLLGCIEFRGWANTEWSLEFDRNAQTLQARIKITDIQLENVPSLAKGSVVQLVQAAIDSRINPLKILRPEQISSVVPIAPAGGSLRLRAREVKPEIAHGVVNLRITYEFLPEK